MHVGALTVALPLLSIAVPLVLSASMQVGKDLRPATARVSLAFYNTREEIDALVQALHTVLEVFG